MLRNAIRFASAESFQYHFAICDGINLMPSKMIRYTLPPKWIERVFDTLWRVKATSLCVIKLVSRSYELGGTKDGSKVRFDNVGHWLGVCFVSWILSRRIRVFEFLITILQSFLIFVLDEFPWTAVSLRKSKLFVRFRDPCISANVPFSTNIEIAFIERLHHAHGKRNWITRHKREEAKFGKQQWHFQSYLLNCTTSPIRNCNACATFSLSRD